MVSYCKHCQDHRNFLTLTTYELRDPEDMPVEYTMAKCEKCGSPSLFVREDFGAGFEDDDYFKIYPANERSLPCFVPDLVKQSYEEAVKCENAKIWTAAVVMVGRALEAVCKDVVPESKTIYNGLKEMKERGFISDELFEWANELRFLRNIGAHATAEKVSSTDACETIDFLQAILEIMYHLRPKFNSMKQRRKQDEAS